jgi:phospholipid N-methyltransferase
MARKKSLFLSAILIACLSAGSLIHFTNYEARPMKLVNINTGFVVLEFKDNTTIFGDRFLERELIERGVAIPKSHRAEFQGKSAIFPNDPLFHRAFQEIYVPLTLASPSYQWQE